MAAFETPHRPSLLRSLVAPLLALILPLFLCGGAASAYYFFDTVREYVKNADLPDYGSVSPGNSKAAPLPTVEAPNIAAGDRINVLLLGIDRRPGEIGPWRTDTMIVATFDPKTKTAGMLSVPRDLWVPIPYANVGENRINTANFYGDLYKYPGGGPALAKKTVEYNLGIPIHFYVLIDFGGFRKIVDTLGGIDIDVPEAIDDTAYPTDNYGITTIHIPAGHIHMDGEMALEYARTRHTTSDFDRSRRQMQILLAIREKALKLNMLSKLPQLLAQFKDTVETDITPQEVLALAPTAAQVRLDNIKVRSIDQTMTYEVTLNNGADVLWPERDKIAEVVRELFPAATPLTNADAIQKENAHIVVLNGTGNAGYAQRAATYLKSLGYNIVQIGNAARNNYAQTTLVDSSDLPATRNGLIQALSVAPSNVQTAAADNGGIDFRVIIGADWVPPN